MAALAADVGRGEPLVHRPRPGVGVVLPHLDGAVDAHGAGREGRRPAQPVPGHRGVNGPRDAGVELHSPSAGFDPRERDGVRRVPEGVLRLGGRRGEVRRVHVGLGELRAAHLDHEAPWGRRDRAGVAASAAVDAVLAAVLDAVIARRRGDGLLAVARVADQGGGAHGIPHPAALGALGAVATLLDDRAVGVDALEGVGAGGVADRAAVGAGRAVAAVDDRRGGRAVAVAALQGPDAHGILGTAAGRALHAGAPTVLGGRRGRHALGGLHAAGGGEDGGGEEGSEIADGLHGALLSRNTRSCPGRSWHARRYCRCVLQADTICIVAICKTRNVFLVN